MDIESLIQDIAGEVKTVSGVKAVVLGGSRARGTDHSASDVDLGGVLPIITITIVRHIFCFPVASLVCQFI